MAADVGAHGAFDGMAAGSSPLLWADLHRGSLAGLAAAAAVVGGAAWWSRRRS